MLHGFVLRKSYIHRGARREKTLVAEKVSFANNLSKTRAQAAPRLDLTEKKERERERDIIILSEWFYFVVLTCAEAPTRRLKLRTFADSERAETLVR